MGQIRQVIAGFQHRRIHKRRKNGIVVIFQDSNCGFYGLGLFQCSNQYLTAGTAEVGNQHADTYIPVRKLKDQFILVPVLGFGDDFRRNPALHWVSLPCPCSHIVIVRHLGVEDEDTAEFFTASNGQGPRIR